MQMSTHQLNQTNPKQIEITKIIKNTSNMLILKVVKIRRKIREEWRQNRGSITTHRMRNRKKIGHGEKKTKKITIRNMRNVTTNILPLRKIGEKKPLELKRSQKKSQISSIRATSTRKATINIITIKSTRTNRIKRNTSLDQEPINYFILYIF